MITTRVEQHVVTCKNKYFQLLDDFCFRSKNLYNHANYLIRSNLKSTGNWLRYADLDKMLKADTEFPDYRNMKSAVAAQQTLRAVDNVWKAYFKSHRDYKKNSSKYLGAPRFPKYLNKSKGRFPIMLTNQACTLSSEGIVKFPKVFEGLQIKSQFFQRPDYKKFLQCRIISRGSHAVVELVYEITVPDTVPDNGRYLGIDLGIDNLAAVSNNVGLPFYLIDGKGLKSLNRYWNINNARSQSKLMKGGTKQYTSKKQLQRVSSRNRKVNDYLHKTSRWVVNFAKDNNINTIVVGKNKLWKQGANMGNKTNQKFVQIPHARLIDMLVYKAEGEGIRIVCVEESYTSKTSFLDLEEPCKHETYSGKRISRGLFKTGNNTQVNADSNGALQIIKKYKDYSIESIEETRKLLQSPKRIDVS